jgi:hypothetical protein
MSHEPTATATNTPTEEHIEKAPGWVWVVFIVVFIASVIYHACGKPDETPAVDVTPPRAETSASAATPAPSPATPAAEAPTAPTPEAPTQSASAATDAGSDEYPSRVDVGQGHATADKPGRCYIDPSVSHGHVSRSARFTNADDSRYYADAWENTDFHMALLGLPAGKYTITPLNKEEEVYFDVRQDK